MRCSNTPPPTRQPIVTERSLSTTPDRPGPTALPSEGVARRRDYYAVGSWRMLWVDSPLLQISESGSLRNTYQCRRES